MAALHQPGQLLLIYPAVDGYPVALFFGQVQTLPGLLAGTGAGDICGNDRARRHAAADTRAIDDQNVRSRTW